MAFRLVDLTALKVCTATFPTISEVEDYLKQDASVGHIRLIEACGETSDLRIQTVAVGNDTVLGTYLMVNCDVAGYQARTAAWKAKRQK